MYMINQMSHLLKMLISISSLRRELLLAKKGTTRTLMCNCYKPEVGWDESHSKICWPSYP